MAEVSRREFLTFAGAAPLGLTFHKHLANPLNSESSVEEYFDPWIEINTKNLEWNLSDVRRRVSNRPVMAVIKCNAYGHGLVGMANSLEKLNVKHFGVVKVQEAMSLRENGIKGMILNFGPFTQNEAEQVVRHDISQSIFSEEIKKLAEAAHKLNKKARVHIKVDTGLSRVGVQHTEALAFIEKVASIPEIIIEGIFTTLTEEEDFDKIQVERLTKICSEDGMNVIGTADDSIGGCLYIGDLGVFYIIQELENNIFVDLMFMEGSKLPVEKVFDNTLIKIFEVKY